MILKLDHLRSSYHHTNEELHEELIDWLKIVRDKLENQIQPDMKIYLNDNSFGDE
jgi:hypothetical protein